MESLESGVAAATAIEPPLIPSAAGARIRRHRRVTGLSGILLFACLFLPAIDACGAVEPYELPPLAPPYLYGLVFALIALSRTPRGLARGIVALRALAVLVMISGVLIAAIVPELGVPEIAVGIALLLIIGLARTSEPRIAASAIAIAGISILWFALWCFDDSALVGVYLSLASASGLALGGILWWRELAVRPAIDMPAAVARRAMIFWAR
jgi:hypothetical protein